MRARGRLTGVTLLMGIAATALAPAASAEQGVPVINLVAGNGKPEPSGDGGQAKDAGVAPTTIGADKAGNVYFNDALKGDPEAQPVIRHIDPKGFVTTVAGRGSKEPSTTPIPQVEADFGDIEDIAVNPRLGHVYAVDRVKRKVYQLSTTSDGRRQIISLAGGGTKPPADGVPTAEVKFESVRRVAVGPDDTLYVVAGRQLFQITGDSKLHLVAGNKSEEAYQPAHEGKPATEVPIWPTAVTVANDGTIYLGEKMSDSVGRLRVIDKDKKIRTLGCAGDTKADNGVEVTKAKCMPANLTLDATGRPTFTLFLEGAGYWWYIVRVDSDNKIKVVTGQPNGRAEYKGDGGKATDAQVSPTDLAFDGGQTLYIADTFNSRIRKISPQAPPVAKDDKTGGGSGKDIKGNVLGNDTGTKITVTAHTEPKNGTLKIDADGRFTYVSKADFTGDDTFTYTITDSVGQKASAKVTLGVKPGGTGEPTETSTPAPTTTPPPPSTLPPVVNTSNSKSGLAFTGASVLIPVVLGGALLIGGGALVLVTRKRRKAKES